MIRHIGEGKPDERVAHPVRLDTGADENFVSLTTVQHCGWEDKIYDDPNPPLVYPYGSWDPIPSGGLVDIPCKFVNRSRWQRKCRWLPLIEEKVITFRVLIPEDEFQNRPQSPFIIGQEFMVDNGIKVP